MAYDVNSLVQEIKTLAKDSSLLDSLIIGWLQETQDRVLGHQRTPLLEGIDSVALTTGDVVKNYPDEIQTISALSLSYGTTVTLPRYVPFREFDECYKNPSTASPGRPTVYTDYGRQIYWNVPLDKNYTMKWRYMRKPARFSSGAIVPSIPEEYKQILIRGALAGVEEYRENFDISAIHLRKVEDLAEDMNLRYGTRQLVRPTNYFSRNRRRTSDNPSAGWSL